MLEEFKRDFEGAPVDLYEYAEGLQKVEDCYDLSTAAICYIRARKHFEKMLDKHKVELG